MYFFFSVDLDAENHVLQIGTQIEGEIARVNVDRLDNTLGGIKTSMIKINVEGLETEVIRGKDLTFKSLSVMVVLIELNRSVQWYFSEKVIRNSLMTVVLLNIAMTRLNLVLKQLHAIV